MISKMHYGPWALIAGGSEGIGASFARTLAIAGINVFLIARRLAPLEDLAGKLRAETGVEVRTLPLDLTRLNMLESIREATDDIEVGLLVYNAGDTGHMMPFLEQTLERASGWVRLIALGQASLAHHFGAKMAKRAHGGILLVGSVTGNVGTANVATYGGAKAFTQMFGEALWTELKPHGIDVLVLIAGATDTPARRRSGAVSPIPLAHPDDVARQGLENLANGPVYVLPSIASRFQQVCGTPRRQIVEPMRAPLVPRQE
jgi:short-subunit dehydrogenase